MRNKRLNGVSIVASVLLAGVLVQRALSGGAVEPGTTRAALTPDGDTGTLELQAYVDPDFGFSLAVPAGWRAVVAAETDAQAAMYEPGYAIGFESPRERGDDVFSDYLMVEILPGDESGLFDTDGSRRGAVRVDGRSGWRDELVLAMPVPPSPASSASRHESVLPRSGRGEEAAVELLVRQASFSGLGFTVGLYAIGERSRRAFMGQAFEVMLRTFRLDGEPFDVS